jgi:hypothetical protein
LCANKQGTEIVFRAIIELWCGDSVESTLNRYRDQIPNLPGYSLEYILYALRWILEQEDVNFKGKPVDKQRELDETLSKFSIEFPHERLGSQLAISLLCNIMIGLHPVDALLRANLDIIPAKRMRGTT